MTQAAAAARHPARAAKYTAMLGVALRQGLSERGALLGWMAFFAVILLVLSSLDAQVERRHRRQARGLPCRWQLDFGPACAPERAAEL